MQLTILGGAGEHGRSSYLLTAGQEHILLDYGVKKEDGGHYPLVDNMEQMIAGLQTVFLSHAHEDHCIALPILYRHGYTGDVWTTRATVQQLPSYFQAWKQYTDQRHVQRPYDDEDEQAIRYRYIEDTMEPGQWGELMPGMQVCWGRSGHLPGSIWLTIGWKGKYIFFSGDYTAESQLLRADRPMCVPYPSPVAISSVSTLAIQSKPAIQSKDSYLMPDLDLAIMDAAYGDDPERQSEKLHLLKSHIDATLNQGGSVLLPVPLYGRGQELMLWVYEQYPHVALLVEATLLQGLKQLQYNYDWLHDGAVQRVQQMLHSRHLMLMYDEPSADMLYAEYSDQGKIIFTPDGMLQSPIARQHYERLCRDGRNKVIFTGHLAKGSYGQKLLNEAHLGSSNVQMERIGYKVHQGLPDVEQMLHDLHAPPTVLVHAPQHLTDRLALYLRQQGFEQVHSLSPADQLEF
ncbi:MBL fold metallo-hydrolase [Paenibacillus kandeliae]|uniref:MBL fold metallo-hydrolase n=1 Tax=Paenibacillus kandeliae TaxID=3231269 RepID=UPI00345AF3A4